MGDLEQVVEALRDLLNDGNDSNKSNNDSGKSDESNDGSSDDNPVDTQSFFCFEDALLAKNVKISVNDIGPLCFPIKEDVIEKLIGKSEKAKFGKGLKTVLDTSYRDTQTIPAEKLKVDIDQQVFDNLLQHLRKAFKLEDHSRLEIHLYNMLIYGPGQFFKRHQDTEKVKNMIATLVMVLPSPHNGGDLIIQHHSLKHRFFGSPYNDIIKCIAFYSDCYHEVKKVTEGYRIALTYNVEIKSGPIPDLMSVDENLKDAVNNYFEETGSDMLVYYLDHEYTEHSLRWYMLKGADRIIGKALLAVGKLEGYLPCLALVDYHESYPEDNEDEIEKDINLYFWIDENNICLESEQISVSDEKICFMKDTKEEFVPYKKEEEGHMGNWAGNVDEWYHRSAVVLWRDTWAFFHRYKKEFHDLHQLTAQPGNEAALLKKIKENSDKIFVSSYWDDESVKKMGLKIMNYLNNKEVTSKVLSKLKISEVLDLTRNEIMSQIAASCDLKGWKIIIKAWESTHDLENLLEYLLPFLLNYMTREDKDLEIAGYLLEEIAKFFMSPKKVTKKLYSYYGGYYENENTKEDKRLCSLLQISYQLGKLDVEKQLMKKTDSKSSIDHFKMFEGALHPKQFARISGDLLLNMTNPVLRKVKEEKYIYARLDQAYVKEICSLLEACSKVGNKAIELKIFNHIMSDPTCSASFIADLLIKLKEVSGGYVSNCTDFKNHALNKIQAELEKFKNPNDCSLAINHPCSCQHCIPVQRFFASTTSMQLTIPAVVKIRDHISSYLWSFTKYLPITIDTIRSGSPHRLVITKLPKLVQDRHNYIARLIQAKNIIAEIFLAGAENLVKKEYDAPAAKKVKNE